MGPDTRFHFARFFDTAMQLKTGIFSYFQTNFAFQQSGRVINAAYGPFFAYLNGLLVLLCGSWVKYQIVSDFIISFVGAACMYHLCNCVKVNRVIGILISVIYVNIGMIPTYINGSAFNGWGQALMPLVVLCGIRMISNPEKPIDYLQLMLVISILAQIHLLSTLFAIGLLIPFFLISTFYNCKKKIFWDNLFKAIIGSIILTANVWGGLLTLKLENNLSTPSPFNLSLHQLSLLGYVQGDNYYWGSVNSNILPLLFLMVIAELCFVIFYFKKELIITTCTILGTLVLLITSVYFPWDKLQMKYLVLQRVLQFPYRLLVVAYPLILISGALIIQHYFNSNKIFRPFLVTFLVLLSIEAIVPSILNNNYFVEKSINKEFVQREANSTDISKLVCNHIYGNLPDYLPMKEKAKNNSKLGFIYKAKVGKKYRRYKHHVLKDGTLVLKWKKKKKIVAVPVIAYHQSQVKFNGKVFHGRKNKIGLPIIKSKKGINKLSIKFIVPVWFKVLNILSIITWLGIIGFEIYHCLKNILKARHLRGQKLISSLIS